MRVMFVCTGNVCRSPMAEQVLRAMAAAEGVEAVVDSAATSSVFVGYGMDRRSAQVLEESGYPTGHRARLLRRPHLVSRDLVVGMDAGHVRTLRRMSASPVEAGKVRLLGEFAPPVGEVRDPYYLGIEGFRECLAQIEEGCAGLLAAVSRPLRR